MVHGSPEDQTNRLMRGTWWKPTAASDYVLAIGNTTLSFKRVQVQVSDNLGKPIAQKIVQLASHTTSLLRLSSFFAAKSLPNGAGDVSISFAGPAHGVVASASIEDDAVGYSVTPHLVEEPTKTSGSFQPVALAAPGVMVGKPDTGMLFPMDTRFVPYSVLHNVSNHGLVARVSFTSDDAKAPPFTRTLGEFPLAAGQSLLLDLGKYFNAAHPLPDGYGNLSVSFEGGYEDLIFDAGSADQSGTYVFQVMPSGVAPTTSKIFCYWTIDGDTSTMISIWNYAQTPQDMTLTLYYSGGQYRIPIHLEARKSYNLDMMTLVHSAMPDADGNRIPSNIAHGSAMLVGPGGELGKMTVVVSTAAYNVRNGTCWPVCVNCGGLTSVYLDPDITYTTVNGWAQASAYYTTSSGGPNTMSGGSWSTQSTTIATVNGSGQVTGKSNGTTTLFAQMSAPLGEMECYASASAMCADQEFEGSGPANVYTTTITNADINANVFSFYITGPPGSSGPVSFDFAPPSGAGYSQVLDSGASFSPSTCTSSSPCSFPIARASIPSTYSSLSFYTGAVASWDPTVSDGGYGIVPSPYYPLARPWLVFGVVTDTQYNTPAESQCPVASATTYIFNSSCVWQTVQLRTQFVSQVQLNGTGTSIGNGILKYDGTLANGSYQCTANAPAGAVRGQHGNVLAKVSSITGQCGTTMVSGQSVAVYPGPKTAAPFNCGDEVILVNPSTNTNSYVKSIADQCPACFDGHVDNYSSALYCSGGAVGNVPGSPFWNVDDR